MLLMARAGIKDFAVEDLYQHYLDTAWTFLPNRDAFIEMYELPITHQSS
jgi:hypothetical protein